MYNIIIVSIKLFFEIYSYMKIIYIDVKCSIIVCVKFNMLLISDITVVSILSVV